MEDKRAFSTGPHPHGEGFHITFNNGYTVSVQWHVGSYSDRGITTAEIAAWDTNNEDKWYAPFRDEVGDDVKGRCSPEEVAAFIYEVSQLPSSE